MTVHHDQSGIIYGPVYGQPGINLPLLWHIMITFRCILAAQSQSTVRSRQRTVLSRDKRILRLYSGSIAAIIALKNASQNCLEK